MRHSHEYYLGLSPEQRKALANQAKTTVYYLHVMALGRPVSLDLALRVHQASGGGMPFYETHPKVDRAYISSFFNDFPLSALVP